MSSDRLVVDAAVRPSWSTAAALPRVLAEPVRGHRDVVEGFFHRPVHECQDSAITVL
ncbi:hypothetical protein [Streptomyces sp. bgisy027]|uniref:hypothetical protein n=1 Tax=Streptomyces sp. bgisy027 TaxID=3413770 RepID=UPI003D73E5B6